MIHCVFDRPQSAFKVYDENGALRHTFEASGDAWGDGTDAPYGHDYPIAPGHYRLVSIEHIDPPIASEGAAQIDVADLDTPTLRTLVGAHKATVTLQSRNPDGIGTRANIGGVLASIGNLERYGRSAIMVHGGGSNAPDPFAPRQVLCKTEGCTRLHNDDLATFVAFLEPRLAGNTVVYSVIGDSPSLED